MKKSNLEFSVNFHLAIGNQTPHPSSDFREIASCDSFIIRNRDFSFIKKSGLFHFVDGIGICLRSSLSKIWLLVSFIFGVSPDTSRKRIKSYRLQNYILIKLCCSVSFVPLPLAADQVLLSYTTG